MRTIDFEEKNFSEVLRLHEICERSKRTDQPQQIHFNEITGKFEYYSPEEFSAIPDDIMFEHPRNAIEKFYEKKAQMTNAIAEVNQYKGSSESDIDTHDVDPAEAEFDRLEKVIQSSGLPEGFLEEPIFDNDDPEVLKATTENLKVIKDIQSKLQTEQREKLARVIADIYKCDIISESDVAQSIVENNEFKKLLSMLFGMLGVTVSSTRVSSDLKVDTANLTFNQRIEYGLEDYRRGAAQCLADVRQLRESGEKINALEETIRELNSTLAATRKELTVSNDKFTELVNQKSQKKEQNLIQPVSCVISWKKDDSVRYLIVSSKGKLGEDGSYPTKYLGKTSRLEKATPFTEEQAKLQVARLVKHRQNLEFVDLKEAGNKEAGDFFIIVRTTIEKV